MNNYSKKKYYKYNNISFKISLCYTTILLGIFDYNEKNNSNEPLIKLILNYNEIEQIIENIKEQNIFKFLYFNRNKINEILYAEEQIINFEDNFEKNINSYFYLYLLISDNKDIINYNYSLNFIKKINNLQNENKITIYKRLLSIIIIELINNYKQADNYEEEEKEKLDEINNNNENIINKNKKIITDNDFNMEIENIRNKKIDKIFIEIINELIKNKIFNNYDYT